MARPDGSGGDSSEGHQNVRRRLRHRMLPLTSDPPSPEVTEQEGTILFNVFMEEELAREHLDPPPIPIEVPATHRQIYFASPVTEVPRVRNYSNITFDGPGLADAGPSTVASSQTTRNFRLMGRQIRQYADEFANSPQGQKVKEKANEVDIQSLNFESLQELLSGVFHDGQFSRTTIIAVFVFCSTLVIRSLRKAWDMSPSIINWCFKYITERVCSVVQQEGGWDAVINGMVGRLFKLGTTFVIASAAIAAVYFLWKK